MPITDPQIVPDPHYITAESISRWEQNQEAMNIAKLRDAAKFYEVSLEWLLNPDPLVLNMHDNKVETGANGAYNTIYAIPPEFLERLEARYNAHFDKLNEHIFKLFELLSAQTGKPTK